MNTGTMVFRDDIEGARIRYETLLESLRGDDDRIAAAAGVHGRRTGRVWAGGAGVLGAAVLVGTSIYEGLFTGGLGAQRHEGVILFVLWGSWLAMVLAYIAARAASKLGGPRLDRESGDVHADIARLETSRPLDAARRRADRIEFRSIALPMMALALLMPLTLHSIVAHLANIGRNFDGWILISLVIVGHAHLVLMALAIRFAHRARDMSIAEIKETHAKALWKTFGFTVLASALPGAILYLIPPLLTAATGLVVVPVMFHLARRWIVTERGALGVA
jgi:hypothetical protein